MNILLTFDYELFFGEVHGTVKQCMIERTNELLAIAEKHNVKYTFFVDVGYLVAAAKYAELDLERALVEEQIQELVAKGHDVQLHIHPHWERAEWDGQWQMNTDGAYKLSDFPQLEKEEIVRKYKETIDELIGRKTFVFRAGGWCIQPFSDLKTVFKELAITHDSTVIAGDFLVTKDYAVDFRDAPLKSSYHFEDDVCKEVEEGSFTEVQITPLRYSPLFYWRLYVWGRLRPKRHKMLGDGIHLSQGGRKKRTLLNFTIGHVSSDGYFATKLQAGLDKAVNMGWNEMVVIGHPKSNTIFSLEQLDKFIQENVRKHNFTTFHQSYLK